VDTTFGVMLKTLLGIQVPEEEQIIKLSTEAYKLSAAFFCWLEPQLKRDLEGIADWAGKLHGAILRIAGVYHTIQHGNRAADTPVDATTMENAIATGKYFLEHAKAAYRLMGADEQTQGARYILRQLEKDKPTTLPRRDLYRMCRGRFKQIDEMIPALELLNEYGYIREVQPQREGPGRKPDVTIYVNPYTYGLNGQNGQICAS
jgi:hypothetical protein